MIDYQGDNMGKSSNMGSSSYGYPSDFWLLTAAVILYLNC